MPAVEVGKEPKQPDADNSSAEEANLFKLRGLKDSGY